MWRTTLVLLALDLLWVLAYSDTWSVRRSIGGSMIFGRITKILS